MVTNTSLILDFDQSVCSLDNTVTLSLTHWQERIRFGCSYRQFNALEREVVPLLPAEYGCVFLGSGDYHHLTYLLLQQLPADQEIHLVVCDNHPDNMRYPWGIHCGSWVFWASKLPHVKRIDVVGICSQDIAWPHSWENHLAPLWSGKLNYWSINVNTRWMKWIGAANRSRTFSDPTSLVSELCHELGELPVYLSIDKDVLSSEVVHTNWDQGCFLESHLQTIIDGCQGKIIAADVTGEVSDYHYHSYWKRWLSGLDGQQALSSELIQQWQQQQNALNQRLNSSLMRAWSR